MPHCKRPARLARPARLVSAPCALCPELTARCSFAPRLSGAGSSGLYIIESSLPPVAPEVIKIEPLHGFFL